MKIKAAVLYEKNKPMRIEEVTLDEPQREEVLVKVAAVGLCHTDWHSFRGDSTNPLPIVLGHEGAGIVEKVGPGVTTLKPGDHVVLSVWWSCGKCPACARGKPTYCFSGRAGPGQLPSGGKRLHTKDGQDINHYFGQSSFAEYAVVHERTAIKVRDDAPLDVVCLLGCGASTGIGMAINMAEVRPGESTVIFGCGGVGLSALMGAKVAGGYPIIAVDLLDEKLRQAKELGADYTINASKEDVVKRIQELTGGGAEKSLECIGNAKATEQAFNATRTLGKCVLIGVYPAGSTLTINPAVFIGTGRVLTGGLVGSIIHNIDVPRYANLYMAGKLPLDKLVSRRIRLEDVNNGFDAMEKGEVLRSVIKF
ncbi:MAG: Zn-dependent alcohol dehydrogenase [Chloroflexi bacterium]|nr:Zn-dependent alcohol dehydrogenase [Chloroflexota bacterium]